MSNQFDQNDFQQEDMLAKADTWQEQLEFIGSLMDMEDQLAMRPANWQEVMQEPDVEELAEMDANAEEFLMSLQ